MYKRRYSRLPRRKILRRRRGLGKKRVSKVVKRYVRRAIHRNIENKEIIDYWNNQSLKTLAASINDGGNCRQLLPLPAAGTASNQRIGNSIRVVKGVIKGHINIKPYDVATNPAGTPLLGKIWLFRELAVSQTTPIQNGSYTTYFDTFFKGNNTSLPFQGYPVDMSLPVNDMIFRQLATKTFKIGASSNTSTGPVGSGAYFDNSPMSVPFYFNWGKYCKKLLKFNEGSSYPNNENIYIVVQVVRADGASSGSYIMAEWHAVNHCKFEDA